MNKIGALMNGTPESSPIFFLSRKQWKYSENAAVSNPKEGSHENPPLSHAGTLISDFQKYEK